MPLTILCHGCGTTLYEGEEIKPLYEILLELDGRLDANLSGASRVLYMGDPTMGNIQTSDASTVEKK